MTDVNETTGSVQHARTDQSTRHVTYVEADFMSLHRGGSTRTAVCICGWKGPQRATLEVVAEDALEHERAPQAFCRDEAPDGEVQLLSRDEADTCEVARDLVEKAGPAPAPRDLRRLAELIEQAPNRLAWSCPVCGSMAGENCIWLLVPHHARLVGHLDTRPLLEGGR
jgi:hypothetical protein